MRRSFISAVLAGALAVGSAAAAPINQVVVFGDSLSDTGNVAELVGHHFPNPPSFHDSFSNGPVAVEQLAEAFGTRADPSLWLTGFSDVNNLGYTPGTNYAVGGALSGSGATGLANQVNAFLGHSGGVAAKDALYVVMIGGNDVRTAAHANNAAVVSDGVQVELARIQQLIAAGADRFLVVNVPDVGTIPEFTQDSPAGQAALATQFAQMYDDLLALGIQDLASTNSGVMLDYFDLYGLNAAIAANAAGLGFTNTTDRCYTNAVAYALNPAIPGGLQDTPQCGPIDPSLGAANIDQFIYWDNIHPTARVQEIWAREFIQEVPEPATLSLLGMALLGLASARRRSLPAACPGAAP